MKLQLRFSVIIIFAVFFLSYDAFAQVSLPDYYQWENKSDTVMILYNSNEISATVTTYIKNDAEKSQYIRTLSYGDGKILLLYDFVVHTNGHNNENPQHNLYEHKNNKWIHVKNFPGTLNIYEYRKELDDFLKSRYGVEFK